MKKQIKFAVIQSGYGVFGVGNTHSEAITNAVEWMEGVETADDVEAILKNRHNAVDGDFYVMDSNDDEFDSYMENQGGFEKRDGKWYEV